MSADKHLIFYSSPPPPKKKRKVKHCDTYFFYYLSGYYILQYATITVILLAIQQNEIAWLFQEYCETLQFSSKYSVYWIYQINVVSHKNCFTHTHTSFLKLMTLIKSSFSFTIKTDSQDYNINFSLIVCNHCKLLNEIYFKI